jgi:protein-tyrosine-phosphatase
LFLLAVPVSALARPCAATRVLLVCPAGSVKSAIAREELKRLARAQRVSVEVQSRGIHPENHISPSLAQKLKADGIDPSAEPLRAFTPADAGKADIVVAFDQAADAPGLEEARKWQVASWNDQYDRARADTLENIGHLLHEIKTRRC